MNVDFSELLRAGFHWYVDDNGVEHCTLMLIAILPPHAATFHHLDWFEWSLILELIQLENDFYISYRGYDDGWIIFSRRQK